MQVHLAENGGAIDRAADAAQNLVGDQLALARLELEGILAALVDRIALVRIGTAVLVSAWVCGLAATHRVLASVTTPAASFGLLALGNLVLGVLALAGATGRLRSRARREEAAHAS